MINSNVANKFKKDIEDYRNEVSEICNKIGEALEGKIFIQGVDALNFFLCSLIYNNFKEKEKRDSFLNLQIKNIKGMIMDFEERDEKEKEMESILGE
jgi:hypothetical protein